MRLSYWWCYLALKPKYFCKWAIVNRKGLSQLQFMLHENYLLLGDYRQKISHLERKVDSLKKRLSCYDGMPR